MAVYVLAIKCPHCNAAKYQPCKPDADSIMNGWVCQERLDAVKLLGGYIPSKTI